MRIANLVESVVGENRLKLRLPGDYHVGQKQAFRPCTSPDSKPQSLVRTTLLQNELTQIVAGDRRPTAVESKEGPAASRYRCRRPRPDADAVHDRRQRPSIQLPDPIWPTSRLALPCALATPLHDRSPQPTPPDIKRRPADFAVPNWAAHAVANDQDKRETRSVARNR